MKEIIFIVPFTSKVLAPVLLKNHLKARHSKVNFSIRLHKLCVGLALGSTFLTPFLGYPIGLFLILVLKILCLWENILYPGKWTDLLLF